MAKISTVLTGGIQWEQAGGLVEWVSGLDRTLWHDSVRYVCSSWSGLHDFMPHSRGTLLLLASVDENKEMRSTTGTWNNAIKTNVLVRVLCPHDLSCPKLHLSAIFSSIYGAPSLLFRLNCVHILIQMLELLILDLPLSADRVKTQLRTDKELLEIRKDIPVLQPRKFSPLIIELSGPGAFVQSFDSIHPGET